MGPGPIYSLGQKQRVFEPYRLSLSSMVATGIPQNLGLSSQYHGFEDVSVEEARYI